MATPAIDTTKLATATTISTGTDGAPAAGNTPVKVATILGSTNLEVTSGAATDLEKLVSRLKAESDDKKKAMAQMRIAMLVTVLKSMSARITLQQQTAFVKMEMLNDEIKSAKGEIKDDETKKAAAEVRSAELQMQIEALEKQIELAVKQGEDHRQQVAELKRQKAEEDEKIKTLENAISSLKAHVTDLEGQVAACADSIGAATLNEVAAAIKAAAGEQKTSQDKPESNADREKIEKKLELTDVAAAIRDALDKLENEIREAIESNQVTMV